MITALFLFLMCMILPVEAYDNTYLEFSALLCSFFSAFSNTDVHVPKSDQPKSAGITATFLVFPEYHCQWKFSGPSGK